MGKPFPVIPSGKLIAGVQVAVGSSVNEQTSRLRQSRAHGYRGVHGPLIMARVHSAHVATDASEAHRESSLPLYSVLRYRAAYAVLPVRRVQA
jgi:hypothetical protein